MGHGEHALSNDFMTFFMISNISSRWAHHLGTIFIKKDPKGGNQ